MDFKKIIISRTDSIGDVILTLPVAGVLKKLYPKCNIVFFGQSYTQKIINACEYIDEFIDWEALDKLDEKKLTDSIRNIKADAIIHVFPRKKIARIARKAKIPYRLGTTNRLYHWGNCNKLLRISRKQSPYHEAQLNLKLLLAFGAKELYDLKEIPTFYGLTKVPPIPEDIHCLISNDRFNLILHPKSKGSAREWGPDNFARLIEILPEDKFEIFITGTKEEGLLIRDSIINKYSHINDLTGKLALNELISFIAFTDGLVAASTGPLHLAAALGKVAIGIYPPIRPMHPGRWAPLGKKANYLVLDKKCNKCRKGGRCECMESIKPEDVKQKLLNSINSNIII